VFGTRTGTVTIAVLAILGLAACGGPRVVQANPAAVARQRASEAAADFVISPAGQDADPSAGISVTAAHGTLTRVTVSTSGDPVTGTMGTGGRSWHSAWALDVDTSYTVTATGKDAAGHPISTRSVIHTLNPSSSFSTMIYEGSGQTYGVGMPIMLTFNQPITNKAAVERSLEVITSKPVVGAWYWDGSEKVDFRPRDYWPADTSVELIGHLNGVEGAPGLYGTHTLSQSFQIGQSLIAVASTATHQTQIYVGGQLAYTWPISTGRSTMPTPNGTYLTVQKNNPVRMIGGGSPGSPGYYNELVNWAVRFTFSGDYYHAAPWSVVDQGYTNVSHGCVNLSPADAETYYNMAVPGDPITITSSSKSGEWDDGWTEWFLSWDQYLAGSATHEAVSAGPSGSTFVSPDSLPADTASTPLGTSAASNWLG
jgi:lipoprotein-anchoring transpeptidase ErfK/SrfK